MEIKVLEKKKTQLIFELAGADHTFCNMLKAELWNDKDVNVATYAVKHPLVGVPKFILNAKEPQKALQGAVVRLEKQIKSFAAAFSKA